MVVLLIYWRDMDRSNPALLTPTAIVPGLLVALLAAFETITKTAWAIIAPHFMLLSAITSIATLFGATTVVTRIIAVIAACQQKRYGVIHGREMVKCRFGKYGRHTA